MEGGRKSGRAGGREGGRDRETERQRERAPGSGPWLRLLEPARELAQAGFCLNSAAFLTRGGNGAVTHVRESEGKEAVSSLVSSQLLLSLKAK